MTDLILRAGTPEDAEALYHLITSHAQEGHLLPRELEELRRHAHRFVVCEVGGEHQGVRRAGAALQARRRSPFAGRLRGLPARRPGRAARRRAAPPRARRRVRDALRLHARRAVLRPPELLHRPASLAAGKDRDRLRHLPAVPVVPAVRDVDVAARRRRGSPRRPAVRRFSVA